MPLLFGLPEVIIISICESWLCAAELALHLDVAVTNYADREAFISLLTKCTLSFEPHLYDKAFIVQPRPKVIEESKLFSMLNWIKSRQVQLTKPLSVRASLDSAILSHLTMTNDQEGIYCIDGVQLSSYAFVTSLHTYLVPPFEGILTKLRSCDQQLRNLRDGRFLLLAELFPCLDELVLFNPRHQVRWPTVCDAFDSFAEYMLPMLSQSTRITVPYFHPYILSFDSHGYPSVQNTFSKVCQRMVSISVERDRFYDTLDIEKSLDWMTTQCPNLETLPIFTHLSLKTASKLLNLQHVVIVGSFHEYLDPLTVEEGLLELRSLRTLDFSDCRLSILLSLVRELSALREIIHKYFYYNKSSPEQVVLAITLLNSFNVSDDASADEKQNFCALIALLSPFHTLKAFSVGSAYLLAKLLEAGLDPLVLSNVRCLEGSRSSLFAAGGDNFALDTFRLLVNLKSVTCVRRSLAPLKELKIKIATALSGVFVLSQTLTFLDVEELGFIRELDLVELLGGIPHLTSIGFSLEKDSYNINRLMSSLVRKVGRVWEYLGVGFLSLESLIVGMEKYGLLVKVVKCKDPCAITKNTRTEPLRFGYGAVPLPLDYMQRELSRLKEKSSQVVLNEALRKLKEEEKKEQDFSMKAEKERQVLCTLTYLEDD